MCLLLQNTVNANITQLKKTYNESQSRRSSDLLFRFQISAQRPAIVNDLLWLSSVPSDQYRNNALH